MIQRKQSLFLFLAGVLLIAGAFCVSTDFYSASGKTEMSLTNFSCSVYHDNGRESINVAGGAPSSQKQSDAADTSYSYFVLAVILCAAAAVTAAAVLSYKDRRKQMRLCSWSVFALAVYIAARGSCIISISSKFDLAFKMNLYDLFPVLALTLVLIARRCISEDEKLVRAVDRIR